MPRKLPLLLQLLLICGVLCAQTPASQTEPPAAPAPHASSNPPPSLRDPTAIGTADSHRFVMLFSPFRTETAALSPDGKHIAYSLREDDKLSVVVVEIDNPQKAKAKVVVATDDTSTPMLQDGVKEKTPARIRWMGWATPNRLIVETNTNYTVSAGEGDWSNTSGLLLAMDADGQNARILVTPRDVAETTLEPFSNESINSQNRILTPDQAPADSAPEETRPGEDSPVDAPINLPADNRTPRSPTFFDYAPGEPDWLIVRTSGSQKYDLFKINIHTGKLRYDDRESVTEDLTPLIDRQGKPRAAIAHTMRTPFPHRFLIAKEAAFSLGAWDELDKIARSTAGGFSLSPDNYLGERAFPVGFDEDPNVLYYASSVGRDTYGIYGLNLKTGERVGKPIESPAIDMVGPAPGGFPQENPLVFNRFTRQLIGLRYQNRVRSAVWLRPEWHEVQAQLETQFPGRSVEITGWDQSSTRFLALIRGVADPGGYYVYDRSTRKLSEFVTRAPWINSETAPLTLNFSFDNPAGGKLSGTLAVPRVVRQKPIPTIVFCSEEPWQRVSPEFQTEMHAFADMGFAVLQINPRGTWGFGAKHRLAAAQAFDEVQVQDIVTAIDTLAKSVAINPKRVGIVGGKRGGYLALRAVQLRPDRFRCAIGIEPTIDLAGWLADTRWTTGASGPSLMRSFFGKELLKANALLDDAHPIEKPVMLMTYRGPDGAPATPDYLNARRLGRITETPENPVRYYDLPHDYVQGLPNAYAESLRNMEDFLNEHIYAYNVKMGETQIIEDAPPATQKE